MHAAENIRGSPVTRSKFLSFQAEPFSPILTLKCDACSPQHGAICFQSHDGLAISYERLDKVSSVRVPDYEIRKESKDWEMR